MDAGIIKFIQHNPTHNIAVVPGDTVSSATLVATIAVATIPGPSLFLCVTSRLQTTKQTRDHADLED